MSRIDGKDYLAQATALARTALERTIPYVPGGMTLSGMDCQGLCEYLLIRCGIPRRECNLAGSNAHYRACLWTGTPEECRQRYGRIPAGAWLFIVKNDGGEPAKYKGDGVGNASHMGVYLGAKEGALHASSSRGSVTTGGFNGTSGSGGWNRVGLCRWVDYGVAADSQTDETAWETSPGTNGGQSLVAFSDIAQVSTPDGNPVKLRAIPSRKCGLYWKVPNGEAVAVEGFVPSGGVMWAKASYGGREGYIMSEFLIGG